MGGSAPEGRCEPKSLLRPFVRAIARNPPPGTRRGNRSKPGGPFMAFRFENHLPSKGHIHDPSHLRQRRPYFNSPPAHAESLLTHSQTLPMNPLSSAFRCAVKGKLKRTSKDPARVRRAQQLVGYLNARFNNALAKSKETGKCGGAKAVPELV